MLSRVLLGQHPMKTLFSTQVGATCVAVVLILFLGNELAVITGWLTMAYVAVRVVVIPCVGMLCIGATVFRMVRQKTRGVRLLGGVAALLCMAGVVLFQFMASFPLAWYLGLWSG